MAWKCAGPACGQSVSESMHGLRGGTHSVAPTRSLNEVATAAKARARAPMPSRTGADVSINVVSSPHANLGDLPARLGERFASPARAPHEHGHSAGRVCGGRGRDPEER